MSYLLALSLKNIHCTKSDVDVTRLIGRDSSRFWHSRGCVLKTQAAVSLEEVGLDPDLKCVLYASLFRRALDYASFYALMKDGFEALLHRRQAHLHQGHRRCLSSQVQS